MKDIIEKLGIERIWISQVYNNHDSGTVNIGDVRKVEQQRNELLEALIDITQAFDKDGRFPNVTPELIRLVEKATGKSWEEIKQAVDDLDKVFVEDAVEDGSDFTEAR